MGKVIVSKIILSGKQYKDYLDEEICFGSREKDICFNLVEPQCIHCTDKDLCEKLFNADSTTKIVNANTADVAEIYDNPEETEKPSVKPVENTANQAKREEYTKESLTDKILLVGKENDVTFTVTKLKTRNKIFIDDTQCFTVTDQTIRIYGVENGVCLGLISGEFAEKTNGILVELEKSGAIDSVLLNYFKMDKTIEPEEDFKEELDLDTSSTSSTSSPISEEETVEDSTSNSTMERRLIGGVSVNVYNDDTVCISTTFTKDKVKLDNIMNKMKELLVNYLGE